MRASTTDDPLQTPAKFVKGVGPRRAELLERMSRRKPTVALAEQVAPDKLLTDEHGARDPHIWFDVSLWSEAAHAAAEGLRNVAADAEENDAWTRRISASASDVRGLVEGIAGRMREVSAGTEDYAAAAQQIAAASQQLNASTEEISASANHLADAAERLLTATGRFTLDAAGSPSAAAA